MSRNVWVGLLGTLVTSRIRCAKSQYITSVLVTGVVWMRGINSQDLGLSKAHVTQGQGQMSIQS